MDKKELLQRIREDRVAFSGLWAGLTEPQMVFRPGPQEDWSLKDLIAHISWWESFTLGRVAELTKGGEVDWGYDVDALNAQNFQVNKDRTLAEVMEEFEMNLGMIERVLQPLDEEQLNGRDAYPTDGRTLLEYVSDNTILHYPMHWDDVKKYVEKLRRQ